MNEYSSLNRFRYVVPFLVVQLGLFSWSEVFASDEPGGELSTDDGTSTPLSGGVGGESGEGELTEEELRILMESLGQDQEQVGQNPSGQGGGVLSNAGSYGRSVSTGASSIQSMNPDIALILDVAGAWFSVDSPMQAGGHDPNHTGFTLQQLEMHLESSVDPYLKMDANIVFTLFGVEVEEAYATSLALPYNLQLRAGQYLTRFGRLNPTHPHTWSFADQPLVNGKFFGGEGSRGLGGELSWLSPLNWFLEITASVNESSGACCSRSFQTDGVDGVEDLIYTTTLEQFFPFDASWSLLWGLSAQFGPNATGPDNRTEIYGTDLYLRYRPINSPDRASLSLQTEVMFRTRQEPGELFQDWGGYSQLVWGIDSEWEVGGRYEFVEGLEGDALDAEWTQERQRTSLQFTYYPSHFSRLRLQGNWDNPGWTEEPIWAAILGFEAVIGAHGAHSF